MAAESHPTAIAHYAHHPARNKLLRDIRRKHGVIPGDVLRLISWLHGVLEQCRQHNYDPVIIEERNLDWLAHDLFTELLPPRKRLAPKSLGARLLAMMLDAKRGEVKLRHVHKGRKPDRQCLLRIVVERQTRR